MGEIGFGCVICAKPATRQLERYDWFCDAHNPGDYELVPKRRPAPDYSEEDLKAARECAGELTTCPTVSHLSTPVMGAEFVPILLRFRAEGRAEALKEMPGVVEQERMAWIEAAGVAQPQYLVDRLAALTALEDFERHPKADALMRAALGPKMFSHLWGPELEALGHAVDVALTRADAAEAKLAEVERERDDAKTNIRHAINRAEAAEAQVRELRAALEDLLEDSNRGLYSSRIARALLARTEPKEGA